MSKHKEIDKELILFKAIDSTFTSINLFIKAATIVLCVYFIADFGKKLAGLDTYAFIEIILPFLAENKDNQTVKYFAYVILIGWALFEREIRKRKVSYLSNRVIELEKDIDPNRESSGIHHTGDTNPEDK